MNWGRTSVAAGFAIAAFSVAVLGQPQSGGSTAIEDHAGPGSEANSVIHLFNALTNQQKQDLLNYLRSL
ncbi:MAG: hypothetical protein ABSG27_13605 [Candidatus Acidiferrales bacterium]|jgi:hypothetical protein